MKRTITSLACAAIALSLCSLAAADEPFSTLEVRVAPVIHQEPITVREQCRPDGCPPCELCPGAHSPFQDDPNGSPPEEVPSHKVLPCEDECCCCECQQPCWYFQVEAIWLKRNTPQHYPISFPGSNEPPILSTDDLRSGQEPGGRITLGRVICDDASIEATYFGVDSWDASQHVVDTNNGLDPFLRVGVDNIANFRNAFSHEIHSGTELHNFELNLRRWLRGPCQWSGSWLAGLRWVHVGDAFDFISHDTDPAIEPLDLGLYSVRTRNDLFGAQLGLNVVRQLGTRFSIGAKFKGGLYWNDMRQRSQLLNQQSPGGPDTDRQVSRRGNQLSSLIETGLFANFQISPRAGIVGGYDVYNITGLAMAPEQLDFTATSFETGGLLIDNGNLMLHGPYVGAWFMW